MDKVQIKQLTGQVVGLLDRKKSAILPVRLLDYQLWEVRYGARRKFYVSTETRPVDRGAVKIGYPILGLNFKVSDLEERDEAVEWLRTTQLTMKDLVSSDGSEFGRGVLPEGSIFKVVSGRDLLADYVDSLSAYEAANKANDDRIRKANREWTGHTTAADRMSAAVIAMGLAEAEGAKPVQTHGFGSSKVVLDRFLLEKLVNMALHSGAVCSLCGKAAGVTPYSPPGESTLLLCDSCRSTAAQG